MIINDNNPFKPIFYKTLMKVDAVVFGGGASGLWTLNELSNKGYSVVLIESQELGRGQTIATQGIIHSGGKYLLMQSRGYSESPFELITGIPKRLRSIRGLKQMPAIWEAHFNGQEPDLSDTISSNFCYFFQSSANFKTRIFENLCRFGLETKLERVDPPEILKGKRVFKMHERIIDPKKLLERLASPHADKIIYGRAEFDDGVNINGISLNPEIKIFLAGSGNKTLAEAEGIDLPMQERPLTQKYIGHPDLPNFFGHCIDGQQTRATITTHPSKKHGKVWQIGGTVAEDDLDIRKELPGILNYELPRDAFIGSFKVNRAEPLAGGVRPSGTGIVEIENNIFGWPTKLVLVPELADEITKIMQSKIKPSGNKIDLSRQELRIANFPWDN